MKVDVVINVFGKPYQTAVTLFSLLEHSSQHIDKIYFIEEREQPHGDSVNHIIPWFGKRLIYYKPSLYLGLIGYKEHVGNENYRLSLRYQYGWERTDKDYLFITHNDCLYKDDVIGKMLELIQPELVAGVGSIGQCWNCPAFYAKKCHGNHYEQFKPTYSETVQLIKNFPSPRTKIEQIDPRNPMPFPECRLNEFACLIHIGRVRHLVMPHGKILPFGIMGVDIGVDWFRSLVLAGYRFIHCWDVHDENLYAHAWLVKKHNGHILDSWDRINEYYEVEEKAKALIPLEYRQLLPSWP